MISHTSSIDKTRDAFHAKIMYIKNAIPPIENVKCY